MSINGKKCPVENGINPDKLYRKYLPLLRRNSVVHGRIDEDLFGELTVAFMQCVNKFKFDVDGFKNAYSLSVSIRKKKTII